jgi:hypothetical protein
MSNNGELYRAEAQNSGATIRITVFCRTVGADSTKKDGPQDKGPPNSTHQASKERTSPAVLPRIAQAGQKGKAILWK